jgi:alkanesulfonate monooxygenase SsuD/methylene tetrahydromethanopterin reductase-like flavin-dependent oxidoreductase (luciferase family)
VARRRALREPLRLRRRVHHDLQGALGDGRELVQGPLLRARRRAARAAAAGADQGRLRRVIRSRPAVHRENGDYNFIFGTSVDALRETNQQILEAADKAGREIRSIASIHCIMGDTDEEAAARVQSYYDGADLEALAHMSGQAEFDASGTTSQIIQNLRIATFMGAEVLTGTPETIAEKLSAYEDVEGLEGLMVCLDDPRREIDRFGEQVLPLLGAATPA